MNPGFTLLFVGFMIVLSSSRELPIDPASRSSDFESNKDESMTEGSPSLLQDRDEALAPRNSSIERWNHSRMLKTTTLGYDEWWFLTSQRPFISYKDFPGRPGVASWKEINPNESRKSRKIKNPPTSAGVSSKAWNLIPQHLLLFTLSCAVLFPCFRWT